MKHTTKRVSAVAGTIALIFNLHPANAAIVTFESVSLPSGGFQNGSNPSDNFTIGGASFSNNYNTMFGSWTGFAFSNRTDTTTPGFGNQYSSSSGAGAGGSSQYAVGYSSGSIMLSSLTNLAGMEASINNTTYAALSMQTGDSFSKKFGGVSGNDPDFFLLTLQGYSGGSPTASSVDFYLADFRFSNNASDYIVTDWRQLDLSPLGAVDELRFSFTSSDTGRFGINTPTYFALDNLAIPEPSSLLVGLSGFGLFLRRKR